MTVFVDTDIEMAQKICEESAYENAFPQAFFEDYASRMERPNPSARWDSPMIHCRLGEEFPIDDLCKLVQDGKKPRDPVSTKAVRCFQLTLYTGNNFRC